MKRSTVAPALLLLAASCLAPLQAGDILYDVNAAATEEPFATAGMHAPGEALRSTFNTGVVGSFFFDIWVNNDLRAPNYSEYGAIHGSAVARQNLRSVLANSNAAPAGAEHLQGACAEAGCNTDTSLAMSFAFSQDAATPFLISQDASGRSSYLRQVHPFDGCDAEGVNCANPVQLNLDLSSPAATLPPGSPTPEPGTWMLVGTAFAVLLLLRSRKRRAY